MISENDLEEQKAMNTDKFKKFIAPFLDEMIVKLGGLDHVRDLHTQMPEHIIHFVAGVVFGLVAKGSFAVVPQWRYEGSPPHTATDLRDHVVLNQEEIRRTLDLVRLRLETASASS